MSTLTSSLIVRLIDQVSRPARGISQSLLGIQRAGQQANNVSFGDRLTGAMNRNEAALARARGGMFDAAAGLYALSQAIGAPVRSAMGFESAMADVKKVVDDFDTSTAAGRVAFEQFQAGLRQMSRDIPLATSELAEIAAAAGEAGFAADELLPLTEAAAKIAVAFGSSAEDTGKMLASMQQSYGMSHDQAMLLADAMNHLSNSMASNAPSLMEFWTRIAADAGQAGFSQEQAVALGSAMIASGHGADVAATSFRNMANALTRGESATKRQNEAYQRLGLDAADVARRMQEDAVGTTRDVLQRISQLPAEVQKSISSDLFGNEARALGSIATNLEFFDRAIASVADSSEYAGSAFKEFETRAQTFGAEAQRFRNRMYDLQVSIGSALLPVLSDLIDAISPVIDRLAEFAGAHPELVGNVAAATAALVGFKAAVAALKFVGLLGRGGALSLLSLGLNTVGRASHRLWAAAAANTAYTASLARMAGAGNLSGLQKMGAALRGMMLAIPGVSVLGVVLKGLAAAAAAVGGAIAGITAPVWGAIAVGVAAVAAAGYSLWKYWDRISSVLSGVGRRIMEELQPAFDAIRPVLEAISPVTDAVGVAFEGMKTAVDAVLSWFKSSWESFSAWLGSFFQREVLTDEQSADLEQKGYDIADKVIEAIKNGFGGLLQAGIDAMASLLDGIIQGFNDVLAWVADIPSKIVEAISSIDLSGIIKWPEPPAWWNYLMGNDEVTVPAPRVEEAPGFTQLSPEQASAASVLQDAKTTVLPTDSSLQHLRDTAGYLREEIAAIQSEIDGLNDGPMKDTIVDSMSVDMNVLQAELVEVEAELAAGEAQAAALQAALQVLSETDATPEINARSIDEALAKAERLAATLAGINNAAPAVNGGTAVDGARAGGGPVRSGGTYLVGEEGPELVTFGRNGFVHTAQKTAALIQQATSRVSAAMSSAEPPAGMPDIARTLSRGMEALSVTQSAAPAGGGDRGSVVFKITSPLIGSVTMQPNQDPMQIVDQLGAALEAKLAQLARGHFSDGGL